MFLLCSAMDSETQDAATAEPNLPGLCPVRHQRKLDQLEELARAGMRFAQAIEHDALDAHDALPDPARPAPPYRGDPAAAFARISREVRQVIALDTKTETEWLKWRDRPTAEKSAPAPESRREARARRRDPRRVTVRQIIEGSIKLAADPRDVESLMLDLDETMEAADTQAMFPRMKVYEIVVKLCDDLGVKPHFRPWRDDQLEWVIPVPPDPPGPVKKLPTGFIGSPGVPPAGGWPGGRDPHAGNPDDKPPD
jgi:hypothetical protein